MQYVFCTKQVAWLEPEYSTRISTHGLCTNKNAATHNRGLTGQMASEKFAPLISR
jgi:hypothetical protein